jgi:multidrug transporter EmrE-like cation transporter
MSYQDILPLTLFEIVGDFGFKEFANKGGAGNFAVGSVGYVGLIYFLIRALQGSQVLLVNNVWDGLSSLIESIAAMVILGERFDDPWQYVGIFMIIGGLLILRPPLLRKKSFVFPSFLFGKG